MTRTLYNITLNIILESPYLVHGNDPGRHALDATLLLDHVGRPILPGTLLQGRIAECWSTYGPELDNADADNWFGKPGNDPQRARLRVQDLVLQTVGGQPFDPETPRYAFDTTRIALDDERGAVKSNALLTIEQVCLAGAELEFSGIWQVWAGADDNQAEIKLLAQQIHAALLLQTQLGAYRGVGFGRLKSVTVECDEAKAQPLVLARRMALRFEDPICVNAKSRRGNVFESGDIIPGGAILGALADMLKARHGKDGKATLTDIAGNTAILNGPDKADVVLAKHFNKLRCTHALPSACGGKRPVPLPQSLVAYKKKGDKEATILDAFYCDEPPADLSEAPKFQMDWKDGDFYQASMRQGWIHPSRHLRLRTAIEEGQAKKGGEKPGERGKTPDGAEVEKGSLFAYDCVYAERSSAGAVQSNWQFDLYLPTGLSEDDQNAVSSSLVSLLAFGLGPIGKTGARAEVFAVPSAAAQDQWPSRTDGWKEGDLVPVVLVTDALLFTTKALLGDTDLIVVYQASFKDLVRAALDPDALNGQAILPIELSHFFATQKLQGGGYLHKRFGEGKDYQPMVLTEAGSVFVFKVNDPAKAKPVFDHWRDNGLDLPSELKADHDTWNSYSYLPQNGYGEVAVSPQHNFPFLQSSLPAKPEPAP